MGIRSMTGYGRAETNGYVVSLSSTNRKQFDASISLPRSLAPLESQIVESMKKKLYRGRVSGTVQAPAEAVSGVSIDIPLAKRVIGELREAAVELDVSPELSLADLLRMPDLIGGAGPTVEPDEIWAQLEPAIAASVEALVAMREREGAALHSDLSSRKELLAGFLRDIQAASVGFSEQKREELIAKLEEAGLEVALDDERLIKEIALYADRADISEELIRIESHLEQVTEALNTPGPVGRGLDFLCQELYREINTIGSKSGQSGISKLVIAFKTELERFREQVQNVE